MVTVFWHSDRGSGGEEFFRQSNTPHCRLYAQVFNVQYEEQDRERTYRCIVETESRDGIDYRGTYRYDPPAESPYDQRLPCQLSRFRSADDREVMLGTWR